jgi:hypothetical protein
VGTGKAGRSACASVKWKWRRNGRARGEWKRARTCGGGGWRPGGFGGTQADRHCRFFGIDLHGFGSTSLLTALDTRNNLN